MLLVERPLWSVMADFPAPVDRVDDEFRQARRRRRNGGDDEADED